MGCRAGTGNGAVRRRRKGLRPMVPMECARHEGRLRVWFAIQKSALAGPSYGPTAGRSPVVPSKGRVRTSSRTAWSDPACAGPSRWPRLSSSSEPSISPKISISIGNSTSNRISDAYILPFGASFQSSHTQLKSLQRPSLGPVALNRSESPLKSLTCVLASRFLRRCRRVIRSCPD